MTTGIAEGGNQEVGLWELITVANYQFSCHWLDTSSILHSGWTTSNRLTVIVFFQKLQDHDHCIQKKISQVANPHAVKH